jgi:hypothetical protein
MVPPDPNRTRSLGRGGVPHEKQSGPRIEVNEPQGQPEGLGTDQADFLRTHSTDEGGEPQGSGERAATVSTGGKGGAAERIGSVTLPRGSEPAQRSQTPLSRLTELAKQDPKRKFQLDRSLTHAAGVARGFSKSAQRRRCRGGCSHLSGLRETGKREHNRVPQWNAAGRANPPPCPGPELTADAVLWVAARSSHPSFITSSPTRSHCRTSQCRPQNQCGPWRRRRSRRHRPAGPLPYRPVQVSGAARRP